MVSRVLDTRKLSPWMDIQSFRDEKQRSYMEYTASQYCSKLVESFSIDDITKDCLKKSNKDILQSFNKTRITTPRENNDMVLSYQYYKKCFEDEAQKNLLLSKEKNDLVAQLEANTGSNSRKSQQEMDRLIGTNKMLEEKVECMRIENLASEQKIKDVMKQLNEKEANIAATSDCETISVISEERDRLKAILKDKERDLISALEEKGRLALVVKSVQEKCREQINDLECKKRKEYEDLKSDFANANKALSRERKKNSVLQEKLSECLITISQTNAEKDEKYQKLAMVNKKVTKDLEERSIIIEELTGTNKCLRIEVEELKRVLRLDHGNNSSDEVLQLKSQLDEKQEELKKVSDMCNMLMNSCTEHEKTILLTKTSLDEREAMHKDEVDRLQNTINILKAEHIELQNKADKSSHYKRNILSLENELISVKESLAGSKAKHQFEMEELKTECENQVKLIQMKITSNAHYVEKKTSLLKKVQEELTLCKQQIEDKENIIHSLKENERNIDKCMFQKEQWERKCEQLDFGYERLKRKYDDVNREFADLRRKTRKELEKVTAKNKEEEGTLRAKVMQVEKERDEYKKSANRTDRKMREKINDLKKEFVRSKERRNEKISELEKIGRKQEAMIKELQHEKENAQNQFEAKSKQIEELEKLIDGLKSDLEKKSDDQKKLQDEFNEFKKNADEVKMALDEKKKHNDKDSSQKDDEYSDESFEDGASEKSGSTKTESSPDNDDDDGSVAESIAESDASAAESVASAAESVASAAESVASAAESVASGASLDETVASLEESIASLEDSGGMGFKFSPNVHLDLEL